MEAKGGREVRRVHIIYFLSRMGRVEHPHLIRVHQMSRNGVHLRDVKRWLSDLRGKDMPDSFSWSYKRRYKTGYVWQDLLDEDLISPISDNEYVLKGSELISAISFDPYPRNGEKKASINQKQDPDIMEDKFQQPPTKTIPEQLNLDTKMDISTKSMQNKEDSSEIEELSDEKAENSHPCSDFLNKNKKNVEKSKEATDPSSRYSFSKSKSYSSGASNVLLNLLTCGVVETNDSAILDMLKKTSINNSPSNNAAEICKVETIFGSVWNQQQHNSARKSSNKVLSSKKFSKQKTVSAAFKPVAEPNCSQCGKAFKPEKLHTHMKSCRGLKSLGKS